MKSNIINLDAQPILFKNLDVVEHIKGGLWEFKEENVCLLQTNEQKTGEAFLCGIGQSMKETFADKFLLNANVGRFLIDNPEFIPDSWKNKWIWFVGTTYFRSGFGSHAFAIANFGDKWGWILKDLGEPISDLDFIVAKM